MVGTVDMGAVPSGKACAADTIAVAVAAVAAGTAVAGSDGADLINVPPLLLPLLLVADSVSSSLGTAEGGGVAGATATISMLDAAVVIIGVEQAQSQWDMRSCEGGIRAVAYYMSCFAISDADIRWRGRHRFTMPVCGVLHDNRVTA